MWLEPLTQAPKHASLEWFSRSAVARSRSDVRETAAGAAPASVSAPGPDQGSRQEKSTDGAERTASSSTSKYSSLEKPNVLATMFDGTDSTRVFSARTLAL